MESKKPEAGAVPEAETVKALLSTIGDTTWRMFVPSVGFTLLGVWLDGHFGTKPWLMFIGIAIGFCGAYLLVKKQLSVLKSKKSKREVEK